MKNKGKIAEAVIGS